MTKANEISFVSIPFVRPCAQCLQHLDVSVLGELVPRLCELLKSGVGLGTKVETHFSSLIPRLCVNVWCCLLNPPVSYVLALVSLMYVKI